MRLLQDYRRPVEFSLLIGLALALPMFRALAIVLWTAYVAVWFIGRWRMRGQGDVWGGPWDGWDTLIMAWLAMTALGTAFAGLHHHEWRAVSSPVRMATLLWLLKRSGYGDREWICLHVCVQIAVVAASVWALAALLLPHDYQGIQLRSVGDTNTSAVYLVICGGALLGAIAAYWRAMGSWARAASLAAVAVFSVSLFASGSRAAAAVAMIGGLLIGWVWYRRSPRPIFWIAIGVAAFVVGLAAFDKDMHRKQELALNSANPILNERYGLWREALVAWRAYPLFGIGADNFEAISGSRIQEWSASSGEGYEAPFVGGSHAHNLYLNTLAERGIAGLALLAALLSAWGGSLVVRRPQPHDRPVYWLAWSGAASALFAVTAIGLLNTTLHDEHGLLAMLFLGIWLGFLRRPHS